MHLPNIRQFSRQNTITFLIGLLLFNAAGFFIINQILSLDGQFRIQNFINIKFIYGNELGDVSSTGISGKQLARMLNLYNFFDVRLKYLQNRSSKSDKLHKYRKFAWTYMLNK